MRRTTNFTTTPVRLSCTSDTADGQYLQIYKTYALIIWTSRNYFYVSTNQLLSRCPQDLDNNGLSYLFISNNTAKQHVDTPGGLVIRPSRMYKRVTASENRYRKHARPLWSCIFHLSRH